MAEFFNMGGYAAFVWAAYAISAIALIGLGVLSKGASKKLERELASLKPAPRRKQKD